MAEDKNNVTEKADSNAPVRVSLTSAEYESLPTEIAVKLRAIDNYADHLEKRSSHMEAELAAAKSSEEKLRAQLAEVTHRERVFARRLTHKDHEMQECLAQVADLKASQGSTALRAALLDPAVNVLLLRLRAEVASHKTRLEETQSELSAWKFTPDSNTGKRLMAKCRLLYQENEELGKIVSSGRFAKLEGDLALHKRFSEEVKKSQSEMDEVLQELDEDVEGMQGTIYFLQQELHKAKDALTERTSNITNGQSERTGHSVARTFSDESDCEATIVKKGRRGSELSLDYNEEELGLTNGDAKPDDR